MWALVHIAFCNLLHVYITEHNYDMHFIFSCKGSVSEVWQVLSTGGIFFFSFLNFSYGVMDGFTINILSSIIYYISSLTNWQMFHSYRTLSFMKSCLKWFSKKETHLTLLWPWCVRCLGTLSQQTIFGEWPIFCGLKVSAIVNTV